MQWYRINEVWVSNEESCFEEDGNVNETIDEQDETDVWWCCSCARVFCGRYQQAHMLHHSSSEGHPVVCGLRGMSNCMIRLTHC